jgi:SAM-dependent methyltransferase
MNSKQQIEEEYSVKDPWGYEKNPFDKIRLDKILEVLKPYGIFERALDIGCGEGFITKHLPAKEIFGYDESDTAMSRCPKEIKTLRKADIEGRFDLVTATGVMYRHYDYSSMLDLIRRHSSGIVLLCNIDVSEVEEVKELKNEIYKETFPYRDWNEIIRIYDYREHSNRP